MNSKGVALLVEAKFFNFFNENGKQEWGMRMEMEMEMPGLGTYGTGPALSSEHGA